MALSRGLRCCQRVFSWIPVLIITSVVLWSYYAYVFELCLCKYNTLCSNVVIRTDSADCRTAVLTKNNVIDRAGASKLGGSGYVRVFYLVNITVTSKKNLVVNFLLTNKTSALTLSVHRLTKLRLLLWCLATSVSR